MTLSYETARDFLYREARYLDDKDWDAWLELYAPDATFWMPAWDDRDQLTQDPMSEISLIWYGNRSGLEDRVFRIRTERSKTVDHFYGTSFYTLDTRGENPLIRAKKVVLKNDYIRQMIDVYHL